MRFGKNLRRKVEDGKSRILLYQSFSICCMTSRDVGNPRNWFHQLAVTKIQESTLSCKANLSASCKVPSFYKHQMSVYKHVVGLLFEGLTFKGLTAAACRSGRYTPSVFGFESLKNVISRTFTDSNKGHCLHGAKAFEHLIKQKCLFFLFFFERNKVQGTRYKIVVIVYIAIVIAALPRPKP